MCLVEAGGGDGRDGGGGGRSSGSCHGGLGNTSGGRCPPHATSLLRLVVVLQLNLQLLRVARDLVSAHGRDRLLRRLRVGIRHEAESLRVARVPVAEHRRADDLAKGQEVLPQLVVTPRQRQVQNETVRTRRPRRLALRDVRQGRRGAAAAAALSAHAGTAHGRHVAHSHAAHRAHAHGSHAHRSHAAGHAARDRVARHAGTAGHTARDAAHAHARQAHLAAHHVEAAERLLQLLALLLLLLGVGELDGECGRAALHLEVAVQVLHSRLRGRHVAVLDEGAAAAHAGGRLEEGNLDDLAVVLEHLVDVRLRGLVRHHADEQLRLLVLHLTLREAHLHGVGHRRKALLPVQLLDGPLRLLTSGVHDEGAAAADAGCLVLQDDGLLDRAVLPHELLQLRRGVVARDLPDEDLAASPRRVRVSAVLVQVRQLLEDVLLLSEERVVRRVHHLRLDLRRRVRQLDLEGVGLRRDDVLVVQHADGCLGGRAVGVGDPGGALAAVGGLVAHDRDLHDGAELLEQGLQHLLGAHTRDLSHEELHGTTGVLLLQVHLLDGRLVLGRRDGRHVVGVHDLHHLVLFFFFLFFFFVCVGVQKKTALGVQ
eukprot:Rhum_TRINITY_DN14326_c19_g1::Rhum_TRINITY_DN14326_c19_g1_i1::g.85089::m.85089